MCYERATHPPESRAAPTTRRLGSALIPGPVDGDPYPTSRSDRRVSQGVAFATCRGLSSRRRREPRHARRLCGADRRSVRAPRRDDLVAVAVAVAVAALLEEQARVLGGRLLAPLLLHPHHLVAHDLAPVRAVLVGLHHRDAARLLVHKQDRLLLALELGAVCALHPHRLRDGRCRGDALVGHARADHHDLLALQLVVPHHQPERRERRWLVLNQAAVVHAEHAPVAHVPPRHRLLVHLAAVGRVD
mmetsp:Transcript_6582/g.20501  ORF Transcript_6582/g.20501 Transcript_6582/m.20501 type:complete len:246 (+) Transcript_6582:95-832(+)